MQNYTFKLVQLDDPTIIIEPAFLAAKDLTIDHNLAKSEAEVELMNGDLEIHGQDWCYLELTVSGSGIKQPGAERISTRKLYYFHSFAHRDLTLPYTATAANLQYTVAQLAAMEDEAGNPIYTHLDGVPLSIYNPAQVVFLMHAVQTDVAHKVRQDDPYKATAKALFDDGREVELTYAVLSNPGADTSERVALLDMSDLPRAINYFYYPIFCVRVRPFQPASMNYRGDGVLRWSINMRTVREPS